jgi:uncharacterized protein YbaA (DUF1428 family)
MVMNASRRGRELSISDRCTRRSVESGQSGGHRRHPSTRSEEPNMSYVDGFVVPVPQQNLAAYRRLARKAGAIWKEYGALGYVECIADDVQQGKHTSFPQSVKLKPGEVVVFSWIVYKSRAQRDRINKQVMADPRLAGMDPKSMPFDGKRMIWGGFKTFMEL